MFSIFVGYSAIEFDNTECSGYISQMLENICVYLKVLDNNGYVPKITTVQRKFGQRCNSQQPH